MSEFDVDEFIRKRRQKESLFGPSMDDEGYLVSFPLVDIEEEPRRIIKEPEEKIVRDIISKKKEKPVVKINYEKDSQHGLIICYWKMNLAFGMDWDIPKDLYKWANNKINLKEGAKVWLTGYEEDMTPPELYLIIGGKGHDNRCTWCKSFWTAFKNNSNDRHFKIDKSKTCIFDV